MDILVTVTQLVDLPTRGCGLEPVLMHTFSTENIPVLAGVLFYLSSEQNENFVQVSKVHDFVNSPQVAKDSVTASSAKLSLFSG